MGGRIYLLAEDGQLQPMDEQPYNSERVLQELVRKYPDLLSGEQLNPASPRQWLLVSPEVGLASEEEGADRWAIDHLFLDQEGVPTIVEVKRSTDTRIRREVVGQMLDYAANAVVYWSVEELRARFEAQCIQERVDPESRVRERLGHDVDVEQFWVSVKGNLQAGRVRLIFLADRIPPELRRVVEFLNVQMDPAEVLALEVKQYAGIQMKTLVPQVVGQTEKAREKKRPRKQRVWDEGSFMRDLVERNEEAPGVIAHKLLQWATARALLVDWGRGATYGSFKVSLQHDAVAYPLFAVFGTGMLEIRFGMMAQHPPLDDASTRLELLRRFNAVAGISLPPDSIDRYPTVPLELLTEEATLKGFVGVFDWLIERVRKSDQLRDVKDSH